MKSCLHQAYHSTQRSNGGDDDPVHDGVFFIHSDSFNPHITSIKNTICTPQMGKLKLQVIIFKVT